MRAVLDRTDARIILALCQFPRASVLQIGRLVGAARNTVHARLTRMTHSGILSDLDRCVSPHDLGYPIVAFVTCVVEQRKLDRVTAEMEAIAQVVRVVGVSGIADLFVEIAAQDSDDLYRLAGVLLAIEGVSRTNVSVSMNEAVSYRTRPLLRMIADS